MKTLMAALIAVLALGALAPVAHAYPASPYPAYADKAPAMSVQSKSSPYATGLNVPCGRDGAG